MRIAQVDYSAISNAYQAQFGAKQAALTVADQKSYKRYMDKAHALGTASSVVNGLISLGQEGMNLYAKSAEYAIQNQGLEAEQGAQDAATQILATREGFEGPKTQKDEETGTVSFVPELQEQIDGIIEGYRNENWAGEVLEGYDGATHRLTNDALRDTILGEYRDNQAARDSRWLDTLNDAIKISAASPLNGTQAISDAIRSATWLSSEQKAYYLDQAMDSYRDQLRRNQVTAFGRIGDRDEGMSYIAALPIGEDEKTPYYNLLNTTLSSMGESVTNTARSMGAEMLAQGVMPLEARKSVMAYAESQGLSTEFMENAKKGFDLAQGTFALNAVRDEMTSTISGYTTIGDMKDFKARLMPSGDLAYLFDGIESTRDQIISDIIDPRIEALETSYQDAKDEIVEGYKTWAEALLASDYKPSEQIDLLLAWAGDNENLAPLADGYIDRIVDNVLQGPTKEAYDTINDLFLEVAKKAAGNKWGKAGGVEYAKRFLQAKSGFANYLLANLDRVAEDPSLLTEQGMRYLGNIIGGGIDAIEDINDLGSAEGPSFIREGIVDVNTDRMKKVVDTVLSEDMANDIFVDPNTGRWTFSSDGGYNVWNEQVTILTSMLNSREIFATDIEPYQDAEGNVYSYPIATDRDGSRYRVDGSGGLLKEQSDGTWRLILGYGRAAGYEEDPDTHGVISMSIRGEEEDTGAVTEIQPQKPEFLIRRRGGTVDFWYNGQWYDVNSLDPYGQILAEYQAYAYSNRGPYPIVASEGEEDA